MVDIASQTDKRGIYLNDVGITNLTMPIKVKDRTRKWQHTTGNFNVFVDLPVDVKGTHMSRLVEMVYNFRKNINHDGLKKMCKELTEKLNANNATVEVEFPYFVSTVSPVSKSENLMTYYAKFKGTYGDYPPIYTFRLGVDVDVMTVCPCALEECGDGSSHVQRGKVKIKVLPKNGSWIWLEELIEIALSSGSFPVFDRLKRPDEKFVVQEGFKNAKFVEDVCRDASVQLENRNDIEGYIVEVENNESIHTHNAFARRSWLW